MFTSLASLRVLARRFPWVSALQSARLKVFRICEHVGRRIGPRGRRADRLTESRRQRNRDRQWIAVELLEERTLLSGTPAYVASTALPQAGSTPIPQSVSVVASGLLRADLGYGENNDNRLIDLNQDGRADIAFGFSSEANGENSQATMGGLAVALNDGGDQPGFTQIAVNGSPTGAVVGLAVADLDGDGDLDIVTASHYINEDGELRGRIDWWENLFDPLSPDSSLAFQRHEVALDQDSLLIGPSLYIDVGDIDRDGHIDIAALSGTSPGTPSDLLWFRNSGAADPTFQARYVSRPSALGNGPGGLVLTDLDGDTDLDFVVATNKPSRPGNDLNYIGSSISWFENSGINVNAGSNQSGQIVDALTSHDLFSSEHTRYRALAAADLTGDSKPEIVGLLDSFEEGQAGSRIEWYQSRTDVTQKFQPGSFGSEATVPPGETVRTFAIVDRDGDGDLDVLAGISSDQGYHGSLLAFDNAGNGNFLSETLYFGYYWDPNSYTVDLHAMGAVDLDGDGDVDIVTGETGGAGGNTNLVAWYEQVRFQARNDRTWIFEGQPTIIDVLANDQIAGAFTIRVTRVDPGVEAEVLADNTIAFTPLPGYSSFDVPVTFDYELVGENGEVSFGTVSVVVFPVLISPDDQSFVQKYIAYTGLPELDDVWNTYSLDVLANDGLSSLSVIETHSWSPPNPTIDGTVPVYATIDVSGRTGVITDVNVVLDITHTWNSDLRVFLVSPDGVRVELFTEVGGWDDNFRGTVLDDSASVSIADGTAPFSATYRPEGNLSDFLGGNPNGTWTLEIEDVFPAADDGTLEGWSLDIMTTDGFDAVRHDWTPAPVPINDLSTLTLDLAVDGRIGVVADVNVTLDLTHTWDSDLSVFLIGPTGTRVQLFTDVGGGGDNFTGTVLDDSAPTSITSGIAPFAGTFRPMGLLSAFNGSQPNGIWRLEITDGFGGDVGAVRGWSLEITTVAGNGAIVDFSDPIGGSVERVVDSSGNEFLTFLPDVGFRGTADFEYTAVGWAWSGTDWIWTEQTATVTVNVFGFNEAPQFDLEQLPILSLDAGVPFDIRLDEIISDSETSFDDLQLRAFGFGVTAEIVDVEGVRTLRLIALDGQPAGTVVSVFLEAADDGEGSPPWVDPVPSMSWAFLNITLGADSGDAPASYGDASHGASSVWTSNGDFSFSGPMLGPSIDYEYDAHPGASATGDDLDNSAGDDEDGVRFFGPVVTSLSEDRTNYLEIDAPLGGMLQAWIDFNGDGHFDDATESLFGAGLLLGYGLNRVTYVVPGGSLSGETYARFRLSSEGGLAPTGLAPDGEVEDYRITLVDVPPGEFNHAPEASDVEVVETAGGGVSISTASAPFSGTFRPEGRLADLDGQTANGVWTLEIVDTYPWADDGKLNSWSIEIATSGDATPLIHQWTTTDLPIGTYEPVHATIDISGRSGLITDVNVRLDITHTWDSDLRVFLIGPNGTRVELFTDVGGSGENFTDTVLDDEAARVWQAWLPSYVRDAETTDWSQFRFDVGNAVHGSVSVDEYGLVSFTPESSDFVGVATFDYTVWDAPEGTPGRMSATGTVTIHYSRIADLGDAPASYGTTLADGGPYHILSGTNEGLRLGWSVDGLPIDLPGTSPSQASAGADGDDYDADYFREWIDDEDGVWFGYSGDGWYTGTQVRGETNGLWVYVNGASGGYLDAWIDFAGDGVFDSSDRLTFGDASIATASAPFSGTFRPQGSLSALDGRAPNGTWSLEITDTYGADTGILHGWSIELTTLDDEGHLTTEVHSSDAPVSIEDLVTVLSELVVSGRDGVIADVNVTLDITHTWVGDLQVFLIGPDGARVQLFSNVGGSGQNFSGTTFDDDITSTGSVYLSSGWHFLTYDIPQHASRGNTYARFRISSAGNLGPTGGAADGEVEDYLLRIDGQPGDIDDHVVPALQGDPTQIDLLALVDPDHLSGDALQFEIVQNSAVGGAVVRDGHVATFTADFDFAGAGGFFYTVKDTRDNTIRTARIRVDVTRYQDFGDAPDSYGTTLAQDGARHNFPVSNNRLYLGKIAPDAELDGDPAAMGGEAVGDDSHGDDEDGIRFMTWIGSRDDLVTPFVIKVTASAAGLLDGWIDFNGDGDFDDAFERVFDHRAVSAGPNLFTLEVPAVVRDGAIDTYARFRISSQGVDAPTGAAPDGEVEDYRLTILEGDGREYSFVAAPTIFNAVHAFNQVEIAEEKNPGMTEAEIAAKLKQETQAFIASFLAANPGLTGYTFVLLVDPVDFVVTDPANRQVGFSATQGGLVNPNGVGFSYTGNGAVEVLIIQNALPGDYRIDLAGLGENYRGSMFLIGPNGSVNNVETFQGSLGLGASGPVVALDFNAPPGAPAELLFSGHSTQTVNAIVDQLFLNVPDPLHIPDGPGAELVTQSGPESSSHGAAPLDDPASEFQRMRSAVRSTALATRAAVIRQLTPRWLADNTADMKTDEDDSKLLTEFWTGLGNSLLGGIPSQVFQLGEILGVKLPQMFEPESPPPADQPPEALPVDEPAGALNLDAPAQVNSKVVRLTAAKELTQVAGFARTRDGGRPRRIRAISRE